jgi:hypothetical protein
MKQMELTETPGLIHRAEAGGHPEGHHDDEDQQQPATDLASKI